MHIEKRIFAVCVLLRRSARDAASHAMPRHAYLNFTFQVDDGTPRQQLSSMWFSLTKEKIISSFFLVLCMYL
jgi:hypothetical protein